MRVIVVTGFELGWDNVVGVFPVEEWAQVQERFPEDSYYVQSLTIDSVEEYD
jgi:hypothetical protein